jgi:signal peptidase II
LAKLRPTPRGSGSRQSPGRDSAKALASEIHPAYKSVPSLGRFLIAAALGALADLVSKHIVFAALQGELGRKVMVIPGLLRWKLWLNEGIVFGLKLPGPMVLLATLATMAVVIALFAMSSRRFWGLHVGLGMVFGGAVGNAWDRVSRGAVRDFIDVYVIDYPVFNVADILLVVGVAMIILHMLWHRRRKPG